MFALFVWEVAVNFFIIFGDVRLYHLVLLQLWGSSDNADTETSDESDAGIYTQTLCRVGGSDPQTMKPDRSCDVLNLQTV